MLGSWSFPLVTNYAPDGIDIRKFLVNIQNRVVYIMIVSKSSLRLETQSTLQEFYFSLQGVETPLADTSSTLDKGEGGKRKRVLSNFLFYFAHTGP